LKGDNILLDPNGVCKITDFGIAQRADDIYGDATHTAMQGSIYWMAPEVLSPQNSVYSAKIDVWSLGCVVLEMWAGQRPWGGENQISVMFRVREACNDTLIGQTHLELLLSWVQRSNRLLSPMTFTWVN